MALLKRLAQIYRSAGGLHKRNLLLPDDPYGLARGYGPGENMPVRLHLLGVPWTRLVNDGFLVDPQGSGSFAPSEEGLAALEKQSDTMAFVVPASDESLSKDSPTVFISYSWDSEEHKEWVLNLSKTLRSAGVNVILDRWALGPGSDRTHFMESSITSSDFVLVVCTPTYTAKSNDRSGGVGYESMIITSQLAHEIRQNKFIPVLRSGTWKSLPIWLQSKIGVDLRGDPYKAEEYNLLLRTLHRAHLKPPPLGPKPVFGETDATESIASTVNAVEATLHSMADDAAASQQNSHDSPEVNQSPIAYAFYETKGAAPERVQAYVRPAATAKSFNLQVSNGDSLQGSEIEIGQRYLAFDLDLRQRGFVRMTSFNNGSWPLFRLP